VYSPELADLICEKIAEGQSMRNICQADDMPAMSTVFKWLRENAEFSQQYARAKDECADMMAEEMLEIADDATNDWMERFDKDGGNIGWQLNGEHVQRSRLRIDTRKWLASKLKPKKYGERTTLSGDPDSPIGVQVTQIERLIVKASDSNG
jgi:hypothetical protein